MNPPFDYNDDGTCRWCGHHEKGTHNPWCKSVTNLGRKLEALSSDNKKAQVDKLDALRQADEWKASWESNDAILTEEIDRAAKAEAACLAMRAAWDQFTAVEHHPCGSKGMCGPLRVTCENHTVLEIDAGRRMCEAFDLLEDASTPLRDAIRKVKFLWYSKTYEDWNEDMDHAIDALKPWMGEELPCS